MRSFVIFTLCLLGLLASAHAAPTQDLTQKDLRVLREYLLQKLADRDQRQHVFTTPAPPQPETTPAAVVEEPANTTPVVATEEEEVLEDEEATVIEQPTEAETDAPVEATPAQQEAETTVKPVATPTEETSEPEAPRPQPTVVEPVATPAEETSEPEAPRPQPVAPVRPQPPVVEPVATPDEETSESEAPRPQPAAEEPADEEDLSSPPPALPTPVVDPVPTMQQEEEEELETVVSSPAMEFPLSPLVAYFAGPAMPPKPLEQPDLDHVVNVLTRYVRGAGIALDDSLASFESNDMTGMANEVTAATQSLQAAASEITTFFFKYILYGLDIDQNCKDPDVTGCEEEYREYDGRAVNCAEVFKVCIHDALAKLGDFYNNPSEFIPSEINMPVCEAPAVLDNGAMEIVTACIEGKVTMLGSAVSRIQEYADLARIERESMANGVYNAHDEAIRLLLEGGRADVISSVAVFYHVVTTLTSELNGVNIPV